MPDLCPSMCFGTRCTKAAGHPGRCRSRAGTWFSTFRGPGLEPATAPVPPPAARQLDLEFAPDTATYVGDGDA